MTIETLISGLSTDEKLTAMDLLWRDLSANHASYPSPKWHERVISDRLANPSPESKLDIASSEAEVRKALDERRTKG
jgi:hypothetical protein